MEKCFFDISQDDFSIVLGVTENEQFQNIRSNFSGRFQAFTISHLSLNFAFLSPDFWEFFLNYSTAKTTF